MAASGGPFKNKQVEYPIRTDSFVPREEDLDSLDPRGDCLKFDLFPVHSVNLIVSPTNTGKSYLVRQLLKECHLYFSSEPSVTRVVIVFCNPKVKIPDSYRDELPSDIELVCWTLEEFDPDNLARNDILVLEDHLNLTDLIRDTISVYTHHKKLRCLFIITHVVLGSFKKNFELLSLVHRIILLVAISANQRLASYIISHFYQDPEVKKHLHEVLRFCEAEQEILLLDFNPSANIYQPNTFGFLALSHLYNITKQGFCFGYPRPSVTKLHSLTSMSVSNQSSHSGNSGDTDSQASIEYDISQNLLDNFPYTIESGLPKGTVAIVTADYIIQKKVESLAEHQQVNAETLEEDQQALTDRATWDRTQAEIIDSIEGSVPQRRWTRCRNVATELLRHRKICVHEGGRTFFYCDKPWTKVSLLHFVREVTRRNSPLELAMLKTGKVRSSSRSLSKGLENLSGRENQIIVYRYYVRKLLENDAPEDLFVNKLYLPKDYNRF